MIRLRGLKDSDLPQMYNWVNDYEVIRFTNTFTPVSEIEHISWYKSLPDRKNQTLFGIEIVEEKKLIGTCGLFEIDYPNRKAELRIKIGEKDEWGKGYGLQAVEELLKYGFNTLNLNRIWLKVLSDNIAAVRIYEKAGFIKEGLLKSDMFVNGSYQDVVIMGVLST